MSLKVQWFSILETDMCDGAEQGTPKLVIPRDSYVSVSSMEILTKRETYEAGGSSKLVVIQGNFYHECKI